MTEVRFGTAVWEFMNRGQNGSACPPGKKLAQVLPTSRLGFGLGRPDLLKLGRKSAQSGSGSVGDDLQRPVFRFAANASA
ncbi:MAG: hypothetical protein U5M23_03205 [Marinagarivorans sp.]|nr:hypothetical protein [Marinagarivorans sp.]